MSNDLPTLATESACLDALAQHLAEEAHRQGLLDVAWRTMDSPVGQLLVAATPRGVVRIAFEGEGTDAVLQELAGAVSPRVLHAPGRLDDAVRDLEAYLADARHRLVTPVDLRLASGYRREVLEVLRGIPVGVTRSYAQVASLTHSPRAVRAVGTACARNPVPLLVPCHRVVRSDGTPGAYRGGEAAKRWLLERESAV